MQSIKRKLKKLLQLIGYFLVKIGKPDSPFQRSTESRQRFLELASEASKIIYPEVDEYETYTGYKINNEWLEKLALHTQVVIKESKLCYAHGRVIYSALSEYLSKLNDEEKSSVTIVETGTARGFSAICMAKAFEDNNASGKIVTFDLISNEDEMYWNCIDDVDGSNSRLSLLDPWKKLVDNYLIFIEGNTRETLGKFSTGRVNFAFLDGAHTYEDVMYEFNQLKDKQIKGDMIVYDDYSPNIFPGIVKAVDHICEQHGYRRYNITSEGERAYVLATKE